MSLNSTHIYLTWEPPPPSQVNGVIREYRLNVTEDATGTVLQYTTTPNDRQITVGPLHPYYIYHCSVVALTVQLGPYTSVFSIQTEEDGNLNIYYVHFLTIIFTMQSPAVLPPTSWQELWTLAQST